MFHQKKCAFIILSSFFGLFLNGATIAALNKTVEVGVMQIELITPAGDPVTAPVDAGDGQNEFTFSSSSTGILTIDIKVKVTPSGVANEIIDKLTFNIDGIGNSIMSWDPANPNGKPTMSGDFLTAKVLFTGLPNSNAAFGTKKIELLLNNAKIAEQTYEVFFPKTATNNPGSEGFPNWFYYWNQVCGDANILYKTTGTNGYGCYPATFYYPYTGNINEIWIGPNANTVSVFNATGIDCFANVIRHEQQHRTDFVNANIIISNWSWNQEPHNHYAGNGDNLDADDDDIPDSWELGPGHGINSTLPVTSSTYPELSDPEWRAQQAETVVEDANRNADWGNPGKQHKN